MTYLESQIIDPERYRRWSRMKAAERRHRELPVSNWLAVTRARKSYVDWCIAHAVDVPRELFESANSYTGHYGEPSLKRAADIARNIIEGFQR